MVPYNYPSFNPVSAPYVNGPVQSNLYGGYSSPQKSEVPRVNGKPGAEAYSLAPNSSALLLDETAPIVWLKTTDSAGYATLTPYSITPYQPEPQIDIKDLYERVVALEGAVANAKPNAGGSKPKRTDAD